MQEDASTLGFRIPVLGRKDSFLQLAEIIAVSDNLYHSPIVEKSQSDGDVFLIPIVMFILGLILWVGSIQMVGGVLKYEIELTAEGVEREEGFSFGGSVKNLGGRFS